jgi:hypothetical protein
MADAQMQLGLKELELKEKLGMGDIDIRQAQLEYDYFRTQLDALTGFLGTNYGTDYGSILGDLGGPGYETGMPAPSGKP